MQDWDGETSHSTASLPRMSLQQQLSAVTPQTGSLRAERCNDVPKAAMADSQRCSLESRTPSCLPGPWPIYQSSVFEGWICPTSAPCSASLVPSTTGTIPAHWRSALLTAAPLTISHWQKICTKNTALRNSEKGEDFLLARLPLKAKRSHFLSRQDLMLTRPSPGNCCVPGWVYWAALLHTSLHYQLLISLSSKLDLNGDTTELSETNF